MLSPSARAFCKNLRAHTSHVSAGQKLTNQPVAVILEVVRTRCRAIKKLWPDDVMGVKLLPRTKEVSTLCAVLSCNPLSHRNRANGCFGSGGRAGQAMTSREPAAADTPVNRSSDSVSIVFLLNDLDKSSCLSFWQKLLSEKVFETALALAAIAPSVLPIGSC